MLGPFGDAFLIVLYFISTKIKDNYKLESKGSISKSSVYQHFLQTWQHEITLTAISFGKLVKKAFPDIT